jgi:uncharacterized repeat protein (TIGR01451 family)
MKKKRSVMLILVMVLLLNLLAIGAASAVEQRSYAAPTLAVAASPGDVLINEFVATPTGSEAVELYNTTGSAIDVSGWTIDGATIIAGQVVSATDYLILTTANAPGLSISNAGEVLELIDGSSTTIDQVGYGDDGGAPKPFFETATVRAPNGVDTGDDAADFNWTSTLTLGAANTAPAQQLGTSIVINEVDPNLGDAFIELYNPGNSPVDLSGWIINVDDDYHIPGGQSIAAGGYWVLEEADFPPFFGLDANVDNVYIYDSAEVRYDQVGWNSAPSGSWNRAPDGVGPNDGYNDATSQMVDRAPTKGSTNNLVDLLVRKTGPAVFLAASGEEVVFEIDVENLEPPTATNIILTDTLPVGTSYVSDDSGVTPTNPSAGVYMWSLADLPPQTTFSFHLTVTLDITPTVGMTITNRANITTTLPGDKPGTNMAEWVATAGSAQRIHDIQGAAHISPLNDDPVANVPGIVTALDSGLDYDGFYMQDPNPDSDDKTAEGIFVFTDGPPGVAVGDMVYASGFVSEFRAVGFLPDFSVGPGAPNNLTITRIDEPTVQIQSTGNAVPTATVIGDGGRMPPTEIIDNDSVNGTVEDPLTPFDPDEDGIDFYESLEGMRVQVNDAVVVGARRSFGDIAVLGDNGAHATGVRTNNDGILAEEDDFNPERIILTDDINSTPDVNVGDTFTSPIIGVIDYSFGNYKLQPLSELTTASSGNPQPDDTTLQGSDTELTIATFNVENLYPGAGASKFEGLADTIVDSLLSPDIIALQEIQDNNGTTDDGTVDANDTYAALIDAIETAGGPTYDWRDIAPEDNQDGGAPGGNIRVGYLFNSERVTFVDRGSGGATDAVTVTMGIHGPELSLSPGRIDPTNSAWIEGRKSLAAEFRFNDTTLFLINNHLKSKTEDDPLFGKYQPPVLHTEAQRIAQAQLVNDFVDEILNLDTNAQIVVLGDMNEFEFRPALSVLEGGVLDNLWPTVPQSDRYSYVFDGNSQVLDHILVGGAADNFADPMFDVVHVNADRYETSQPTDHDPLLFKLTIPYSAYLPLFIE